MSISNVKADVYIMYRCVFSRINIWMNGSVTADRERQKWRTRQVCNLQKLLQVSGSHILAAFDARRSGLLPSRLKVIGQRFGTWARLQGQGTSGAQTHANKHAKAALFKGVKRHHPHILYAHVCYQVNSVVWHKNMRSSFRGSFIKSNVYLCDHHLLAALLAMHFVTTLDTRQFPVSLLHKTQQLDCGESAVGVSRAWNWGFPQLKRETLAMHAPSSGV